jgi:hypothetical protein
MKKLHKAAKFNDENLTWCIEQGYIEEVDWILKISKLPDGRRDRWYIFFYSEEKALHCKLACG